MLPQLFVNYKVRVVVDNRLVVSFEIFRQFYQRTCLYKDTKLDFISHVFSAKIGDTFTVASTDV